MTLRRKNVLVIGASGFIGNAIYTYLRNHCESDCRVTGTSYTSSLGGLDRLDITSPADLERFITRQVPDFIIFAAGDKNVPECEADYDHAYALNTQPVISLVSIISRHMLPTKLVYISTDYVFDGKDGQYRDDDAPNPTTNYGKTKFLAEKALLSSAASSIIVRTGAVMGKGGVFFDWLINQMRTEKSIVLYDNVFFSPTPLTFLSEMIATIVRKSESLDKKILHVVGEKRLNRHEFALLVNATLDADITILAEKNPGTGTTFQHDLSMVPSDLINTWRKRTFEDYLRDEVLHADVR